MTKKEIEKKLDSISDKLDKLSSSSLSKAKKLEEIEELLKDVRLDVKDVRTKYDAASESYTIEVEYSCVGTYSAIGISAEDAIIHASPMFRAINMLNLISIEDMSKINDKISDMMESRSRMLK